MNKILIIQSSSRTFETVKKYVRDNYSSTVVDVLATESATLREQHIDVDGELISLKHESFDVERLTQKEKKRLQSSSYNVVYVLFNEFSESGYGNVMKLASFVRADRILGMDVFGHCRRLDSVTGQLFRWKLWFNDVVCQALKVLGVLILILIFIPEMIARVMWYRNVHSDQQTFEKD